MDLKDHFQKTKKRLYLEGAFSYANFTMLNGLFLIGFALAIGANELEISILVALPLLANLLQLASPFILEFTGTKKWTAIVSLFLARVLWLLIAFMAFGFLIQSSVILGILVLISSILTSIGNLGILNWIRDLVPTERLARFFGKRNMYATAGGMIAYLIGAYLIDRYDSLHTYGYIFLIATFIGISAFVFVWKVPEKKKQAQKYDIKEYIKSLKDPLKNKEFRPLLIFAAFWGFAINFASPFFIVFLLEDIGLSFFIVSIFLVVDAMARIFGSSLWRSYGDRFGAKPLLVFCATITATFPLMMIFINKGNYLLMPLIYFIGALSYAGVDIALVQILFKSASREKDAYYLSSFSAVSGITSALGPVFGGVLATIIRTNGISFLTPIKIVFLIGFLLRVLGLPLITKIKEKEARHIDDMVKQVKSIRYVSFIADIYSITDYVSKMVLMPQKQIFILQRQTVRRTKKELTRIINIASSIVNNKITKGTLGIAKKNLLLLDKTIRSVLPRLMFLKGTLFYRVSKEMQKELDPLKGKKKVTLTELNKISEHISEEEREIKNAYKRHYKKG